MQEILKHDHYDLVINSVVTSYVGFALAWYFQCPFVIHSPNVVMGDMAFRMGDFDHTAHVPFMISTFSDKMTLS